MESAAARFRRADRAEENGSVACADVFPGNREDVCKEAGSIVMQERAGAKAMDKTSGEKTSRAPRYAQIDSEKARLRDKPPRNPCLPRRYVSAASPFFLRLSHGHCAPAYACPLFFTTRETTLRPRPASTVTAAATSAAPTERRASAPRRRNKRGAFPCGAAAAAHPRAPAPRAFPTPARPRGRFLPSVYGKV